MDWSTLDALSACFARDEAAANDLREFSQAIAHELPNVIHACVQPLLDGSGLTPDAIAALERSLAECAGSFQTLRDRDGLERKLALGRCHFAIGMPRNLLIAAFGRFREQLLAMWWTRPFDRRLGTMSAINRELDLELALILQGYAERERRQLTNDERFTTAAAMAHDLRSPLATIETSAYLIAQRLIRLEITDGGIEGHVEKVRKHVQLCSSVLSDLLETARRGIPTRRPLNVEQMIDEALDAITWPPNVVRVKAVADGLSVFADREQFRTALVCFFEKARDAIPESGALEIAAVESNAGVAFRIGSDGPSIPPEEQKRMLDSSYAPKTGGNDPRLALCHRIVAAHGGTLEFEQNQRAVVFRVWFPADVGESRSCEINREHGADP